MTRFLAIAAVAALAMSGPAEAQGVANFFAGFSAGLQRGMQGPYAPYGYEPPYYAPPPNPYVVPQPVYQNYRFPDGRSMSCVTVMMNTTCN